MPLPVICRELQQKAENELNEVPSKIQEHLNYLRKWLSEPEQQHLNARTDDQSLIKFLRGSKFNVDKTKDRINLFYTYKTTMPEFFSDRDPSCAEVQEVLNRRLLLALPETTGPAEPRLILMRAGYADPEFVSVTNYIKVFFMYLDILCIEDLNSTIAGISFIVDLKGMSYRYITQITPRLVKRFISCLQNAYPIRLKGIYYINAPSFFVVLYNILKIVLSEKLRKRIHFYGKSDDTYDDIPRSVFPKDYGGEQTCYDKLADECKLKVESYREWFINDARHCLDESKRRDKPKNIKSIFG